jgi:glucose-1-phosphate cytidylyltransferase
MKNYADHGFTNFILCLGYKGSMIREYFLNYGTMTRDFTLTLGAGPPIFHDLTETLDWRITFVDTGATTMTGARLKRVEKYIATDYFMVTYADGVADLNIGQLFRFHCDHGRIGTVTGVRSPSQFGELDLDGVRVRTFSEKPQVTSLINGGFFVFCRDFFRYLDTKETCVLEREPLELLAAEGELFAFRHDGFWQCLDTYKDQMYLNELWRMGRAPWCRNNTTN